MSSATIQNAVSAISPFFLSAFWAYPVFPRLFALIPAVLSYQKPVKTKVKVENRKKCRIWNMIQNGPKFCVNNRNILFIRSYWDEYILFGMEWNVSFLWSSLWEHLLLQAISIWEKNKKQMPNLDWKAINSGAKSRNCTEISSDWKIIQCMKQWMYAYISFLVIFCMHIQDFKTKEPLSKKKFSLLFLLKSWENGDTAFCIVTDDVFIKFWD